MEEKRKLLLEKLANIDDYLGEKFLNEEEPTPEEIHALRTCTRRLEASLQALAVDSRPNERRLLRGLAKLRRRATSAARSMFSVRQRPAKSPR